MNKRLEKQLNEYFYSEEYYKHIEDGEKLKLHIQSTTGISNR